MPMMRVLYMGVLALAVASTACSIDVRGSGASLREEKRFTVSGGEPVMLKLTTFDGVIQVRSWERKEVLVEIERRGPDQEAAEALVVNQTQEGNRIVIEARGRRESDGHHLIFGGWAPESVNLTVTTPRRVSVEARTSDGLIDTRDLNGALDLSSGDGRIVAARVDGEIKAHTGDGVIVIDDAVGAVAAETGDGSVEVAGRLNALSIRTGDGTVRVDASDGSTMTTDWRITTGDGRIAMRLPNDFNAAVEASTGDGPIRIDGIESSREQDDRSDGRRVVGQLGSGGSGTLRLRTGDGSIQVSR